jgi:dTDP-4-amino-4,6-dideoxygalactose transaminase
VITSRTRAILPVHLFGQPASMSDLSALAHEHSLLVIEDAAQAIGATFEDRQVGSLGNAGCFSFFPTKNLGAFGDGGLLTTNDQALAETVRALRSHGFSPKHHSRRVGGNFRLDALQAAILRVKLPHLPGWIERRQAHAQRYLSALAPLLDDPRSGAADLGLPHARPGRSHVYNQFVLQTPERDALAAHLARRGIESERYYPVPIHLQESCAPLGYQLGDFPNAEALARTCLALPMYPELEEWMIDSITQALLEFYAR